MEPFEEAGVFWLPTQPDRRIAGKLAVDRDGIGLTVYDSLRPVEFPADQVVEIKPERVVEGTVLGRLTDREAEVTLLDVSGTSFVLPLGETTESFDVSTALVGGHVDDRAASRLVIEFDVLRDWVQVVGAPSFNMTELRLDIARRVLHAAQVNGHDVEIVQTASTTFGPTVVVNRRTCVEITGGDLAIDSMFNDWIRPLHDFLIVALGRPVAVTGLQATMRVTIGADVDITIYTNLIQPEAHDGVKPLNLRESDAPTLVLPDDPAIEFAELLPAWFGLREELLDAVVQLCAPFYVMFIYSEHRYGSVFQAAEALARSRFESRQRPKGEHAARVAAIVDAARAAGVEEAELEWAGNVLRSRNDRPLKYLIDELLERSGVVAEPQRTLLAPKMASARAGVSHGGAEGVDSVLRYWLGQVLQWVVRAHLLDELGIPADAMAKRLRSKPGFQRALNEAVARSAPANR
ncbi:HEPN domain-containing protein [uncultured Aeromicrobium sp.]|uniref:ApeA N-terminal domain 1-containing protein n=1 Tax=uncultured Aeromicrobium sp. TaxID=337820 RepID=UPI0025EE2599|nr:HEPN domain-containing protein [uncultured Aeromicrobium sp.]